jgi:hypothetical protein
MIGEPKSKFYLTVLNKVGIENLLYWIFYVTGTQLMKKEMLNCPSGVLSPFRRANLASPTVFPADWPEGNSA